MTTQGSTKYRVGDDYGLLRIRRGCGITTNGIEMEGKGLENSLMVW